MENATSIDVVLPRRPSFKGGPTNLDLKTKYIDKIWNRLSMPADAGHCPVCRKLMQPQVLEATDSLLVRDVDCKCSIITQRIEILNTYVVDEVIHVSALVVTSLTEGSTAARVHINNSAIATIYGNAHQSILEV